MPSYPSTWWADQILNWWFRDQTVTPPASLWLALHTEDPGVDGLGAEVSTSGTGYGRVEITSNTTNWAAPSAAGLAEAITNLLQIVLDTPVGTDWGVITGWGLWTHETAGDLVIGGQLETPRSILAGDPASVVPVSQVTVTIGGVS